MRQAVMRHHVALAMLALVLFVAYQMCYYMNKALWVSDCMWLIGIPFAVIATYAGTIMATTNDNSTRGSAIASAVTGAIVLWALLSGVWGLFWF